MTKTPNALTLSEKKKQYARKIKYEIFFRRHPYILLSIIFFVLPMVMLIVLGITVSLADISILTLLDFFR